MKLKYEIKHIYNRLIFFLSANNIFYRSFYKFFYKPKNGSLSYFTSEYSKNTKKLFFIQVGANDGFNQDPIHRYIKRDVWKGILLEPLKDVYTNYLEKLYRKNKNVITLNAAIDTRDGELPIYRISFSDARWATGLTSFRKEVILNAINSGYVKKKALKQGIQLPDKINDYIKEEKVECISFGSLLDRYQVAKINWLQIDTEGYDFEIIKMFDFEKMKPEVIVYEHFHLSEEDLLQCEIFLNNNNYLTKKSGVNTISILSTLNKNLLDVFHSLN